MGIAPIPNLIPVRISASSAGPPDVPTARAIDFRRQQGQGDEQDATYTPGGSQRENDQLGEEDQSAYQAFASAQEAAPDGPDEPGEQHIVSVFA